MRGLLEEPDQMDQHSNSVPKQYSACLGDKVLRAAGRRVQRRGAGVLSKFEDVGLLFTLLSRGSLLLLVQAH